MADHDLKTATLDEALARLGSGEPTPGGGAAAALAGALGASMVRMLALLTTGREGYEDQERLMAAIADQAEDARQLLVGYAAKDAAVYDTVTAAYALPHETEEEQQARAEALEETLKAATEIPLRVMEECLQIIGLAKNVVESGNRNAISDGAIGGVLARAGMTASSFNVKANLAAIKDAEYVQMTRTRLDEMLYMGTKVCTGLDSYVNDLWTRP